MSGTTKNRWRPLWRTRAFLALWAVLWHAGLPFILIYLRRRARADPLYGAHLAERFGRHDAGLPGAVWIHAVSLGELRSAVPLIAALLARGERIVTTHFTPAGRREAERVFADDIAAGRMRAVWVPFEFGWAWAAFFRAFRPAFGLVMEIEIWPRMVMAARRAGVPLLMCNAQYPSRSMARDARGHGVRHDIMRGFAGALVKSDLQRDRFASIGVRKIAVTGELRFAQPVPPQARAVGQAFRDFVAPGRRVVCIASAVEGEDATYVAAIRAAQGMDIPFVIYVPRRPERFDAVFATLATAGLRVARRSEVFDAAGAPKGTAPQVDVLLGDSLGEMYMYIAASDLVVTGGGFVAAGAHNIIEPLALGRPVIVGPVVHTIEYPATEAVAAGVCRIVDGNALGAALSWGGPGAGTIEAFFAAHSGAVDRTLAALPEVLAVARGDRVDASGGSN